MTGRIIKGIGGFYYVHTEDGIYTCKAKGVFRHNAMRPLVGDKVEIDIIPGEEMTGNISKIYERTNELIRPNVANVDQALIIFALIDPVPNFVTLDKMILQYMAQDLPVLICFNKDDIADPGFATSLSEDYAHSGCRIFVTSAKTGEGIEDLKSALSHKTTTVAGPSGAGKSSVINMITGQSIRQTGEISEKLARGKHTTRASEIIPIGEDSFIIDTPGFSSFDLADIKAEDLSDLYEEFAGMKCRFMPCSHTHEPDCGVREAADNGIIPKRRYDDYVYIYKELTGSRRY